MALSEGARLMLDLIHNPRGGDMPTDTSLFLMVKHRLVVALNAVTKVAHDVDRPYSPTFRLTAAALVRDAEQAVRDLGLDPDEIVTYDETLGRWRMT